jgi:hypothetical protein
MPRLRALLLHAAVFLFAFNTFAAAQNYPNRPVVGMAATPFGAHQVGSHTPTEPGVPATNIGKSNGPGTPATRVR